MPNIQNTQNYTVRGEEGTLEVRVGPNTSDDLVRSSLPNENPENHTPIERVELSYKDSDGKRTKEIIVDGQVVFRGGYFDRIKGPKGPYEREANYNIYGLASLFSGLMEIVPQEMGRTLRSCYSVLGIKR